MLSQSSGTSDMPVGEYESSSDVALLRIIGYGSLKTATRAWRSGSSAPDTTQVAPRMEVIVHDERAQSEVMLACIELPGVS